jgi:hypothetical protein
MIWIMAVLVVLGVLLFVGSGAPKDSGAGACGACGGTGKDISEAAPCDHCQGPG